jgi:cytochrome c2
MVPRLWEYQIELPARTVVHLVMGLAIGIILTIKILIVRFFKHLEGAMAPLLGTGLLICSTILIGLSAPIALREAYMSRVAPGVSGLERVRTLLPKAGLPGRIRVERIASVAGLSQGRALLRTKCVQCHDLRTVLAKPRTPENWLETINRMAERAVLQPISEAEQWSIAGYLVAVSPDLQKALQLRRRQQLTETPADSIRQPVAGAKERAAAMSAGEVAAAKGVFESTCMYCHPLSTVAQSPPHSEPEARTLVARMVENGLNAPRDRLEQIVLYLARTYTK